MDIKGVVRYFKSVKDVSALYVFGAGVQESEMGLGVLADDATLDSDDIDGLEHDCILRSNGPLSVVMLNTAPLYLKHYVASTGKVVFERSKGSHLRFTRRALDEYFSVAFHDTGYGPEHGVGEYPGDFTDEVEYLS